MTIRIRPSIVLFGDSLTQLAFGVDGSVGWASLLASSYSRRADVLNRGFRGYNTRMGLGVMNSVFAGYKDNGTTLFCTVFFGANDAALPGEKRHVPLEEFGNNIRKIVTSIRESFGTTNDVRIILMTPPPVNRPALEQFCLATYGDLARSRRTNDAAREYGEKIRQIGTELGCHVLDCWELLGGNDGADSYGKHLVDGLHLTGSGNALVFEGLMALIRRELPHLAPMEDGDGRYGTIGVPLEEKLWTELC